MPEIMDEVPGIVVNITDSPTTTIVITALLSFKTLHRDSRLNRSGVTVNSGLYLAL